jgi:uncharacterized membrane protein
MKISPLIRFIALSAGLNFILLACRFCYSGTIAYAFLLWNIFLSAVPLYASTTLLLTKKKYVQWILMALWLLFFPNALYMITDLVHLKTLSGVPIWFDAILFFSAAANGLLFAYISLQQVKFFLATMMSRKSSGILLNVFLCNGSFGVYSGRYLRWNSWDIISDPITMTMQVSEHIIHPLQHLRTWGMTITLTLFFSIFYVAIKKIPGLLNNRVFPYQNNFLLEIQSHAEIIDGLSSKEAIHGPSRIKL